MPPGTVQSTSITMSVVPGWRSIADSISTGLRMVLRSQPPLTFGAPRSHALRRWRQGLRVTYPTSGNSLVCTSHIPRNPEHAWARIALKACLMATPTRVVLDQAAA